jgi:prevent-host-death family protein
MQAWSIQDAKAKISELVKYSQLEPQSITYHGKPVAVMLSINQFEQLSKNTQSLVSFMRSSPFYGDDELSFEREQSLTREVEF